MVPFSLFYWRCVRKPKGMREESIQLKEHRSSITRSRSWGAMKVATATWTSSGCWLLRLVTHLGLFAWCALEDLVTAVWLLGMCVGLSVSNIVSILNQSLVSCVWTSICVIRECTLSQYSSMKPWKCEQLILLVAVFSGFLESLVLSWSMVLQFLPPDCLAFREYVTCFILVCMCDPGDIALLHFIRVWSLIEDCVETTLWDHLSGVSWVTRLLWIELGVADMYKKVRTRALSWLRRTLAWHQRQCELGNSSMQPWRAKICRLMKLVTSTSL